MKKFSAVLLIIMCFTACLTAASGCAEHDGYTMYVPDGAPALAAASLIKEGKLGGKNLDCVVTTGEIVKARVLNGEADFAILPSTAAANLYAKGADYVMFSANVFGVLYIVGKDDVSELSGLKGKLVCSIGKGDTPEYIMRSALHHARTDYAEGDSAADGAVTFRYCDDGSSVSALLLSGKANYGLLGEPAASVLLKKGESAGLKRLFDLQELWAAASGGEYGYPQACLLVKKSLAEEGELMEKLGDALALNGQFLIDNAAELQTLLNGAGSLLKAEYTAEIIEKCNVRFTSAIEVRADMERYFSALKSFNAAAVTALPDDGFYYGADK